jgi:hypothetical protein
LVRAPLGGTALAALVTIAAGCTAGSLVWTEGSPLDSARVAVLPEGVDAPGYAITSAPRKDAAPQGGLMAAVAPAVPFTGFNTRATLAADQLGFAPASDDMNVYHSTLFEDGFGFSLAWIISAPGTSAPALGDSYVILTGDYVTFKGRDVPNGAVDSLTMVGIWVDMKTMLNKPGAKQFFKPYVSYGLGLAATSAVTVGGVGGLYDDGYVTGLRAGLGIDFKVIGLKFFVDVGAQITSSLPDGGTAGLGDAEPMFVAPIRAGLVVSF